MPEIKILDSTVNSIKVGGSDCKIYMGDTLVYPNATPYTEILGIERKAGNLGWVDLGIGLENSRFKVEVTHTYKTAAGGRFFGINDNFRWFKSGSYAYYDLQGRRLNARTSYYPMNVEMTTTLQNFRMTSSYSSSGNKVGTTASSVPSGNIFLFTGNDTTNGDLGVFHRVKVYYGNDNVLSHDFIPVIKNSDNTVTMYDLIGGNFAVSYGNLAAVQ